MEITTGSPRSMAIFILSTVPAFITNGDTGLKYGMINGLSPRSRVQMLDHVQHVVKFMFVRTQQHHRLRAVRKMFAKRAEQVGQIIRHIAANADRRDHIIQRNLFPTRTVSRMCLR
ncbi:MAG: hypothetical protein U0X93_08530 [Anaerolineales bacterium]